jgi:hypothetical protein
VPLHLHRRLHLHVILEEAAAERGLVIANLLVFHDGVLTAVFIRDSVALVEMLLMRPTVV